MRITLPLPAVALALSLVLAGCGDDAADPATDLPTSDAGTDTPAAAFGFLTAVDVATGTIGFDEAVWVASDAEPNGYRIDNPQATVVTLPVADDADIEVLRSTGDPSTAAAVDLDGLEAWWAGPAAGQELAFDLEITDGTVTSLRFVYRP